MERNPRLKKAPVRSDMHSKPCEFLGTPICLGAIRSQAEVLYTEEGSTTIGTSQVTGGGSAGGLDCRGRDIV